MRFCGSLYFLWICFHQKSISTHLHFLRVLSIDFPKHFNLGCHIVFTAYIALLSHYAHIWLFFI